MRIARFSYKDNPTFGILDEQTQDLVVIKGDPLFSGFHTTGARVPVDEVKILSPVIPRSKVVGVGGSYRDAASIKSAKELSDVDSCKGASKKNTDQYSKTPATIFIKPNTSVIGPDDPIVIPEWAEAVTFEAEIAVVIGRICKDVPVDKVSKVVFGYTVANDLSANQDITGKSGQPGFFAQVKGFDSACPLGPFIELDLDPDNLMVSGRKNGELYQKDNTHNLVMPVAEIISWISHSFTLLPGDVILTGTPAGAGIIYPGDSVEVEVEKIGVLRNPVVQRKSN